MAREASLQETLTSAFEYQMENVYTAIPAIVITVREEFKELSVDVQPTINIKTLSGEIVERPPILNVPVQMPIFKRGGLTFPVSVNDTVLLVFSMRGLDLWKRSAGYPSSPSDFRKFDKRDAVAIPGVFPFQNSPNNPAKHIWPHSTQDVVLVNNLGTDGETEVRILNGGGVVVNTKLNAEINCMNATVTASNEIGLYAASMTVNVASTTWNGNIVQNGNYTLGSILVNTHTHPDPQGGSVGPMQ